MSYKIKNKKIDLLAAYNRNDGLSQMSSRLRLLLAPLILVGLFAVIFAFIFSLTLSKKNALKTVNEDIEVIQLKTEATDKAPFDELQKLETTYDSLETLDKSLSSLPKLTKNKILYLKKDLLTGITLKTISFDQEANAITATLSSANVQNIEKYVSKIKKHTEFKAIEYTGYQETTDTNIQDVVDPVTGMPLIVAGKSTSYGFQVKITLDGTVGEGQ